MLKEFKTFILRGNVIDLAVGVAIGAAFTAVVASFSSNIITPLLAIPGDVANFDEYSFTVNGAVFKYGVFINAVISFVITAAVLFFLVVKPVNHLVERRARRTEEEKTVRDCPRCLSEIPVAASRCAFCTSDVPPIEPTVATADAT